VQLSSGSCSAASGSVKYGRLLRRENSSLHGPFHFVSLFQFWSISESMSANICRQSSLSCFVNTNWMSVFD
jgi:hypothetical protein